MLVVDRVAHGESGDDLGAIFREHADFVERVLRRLGVAAADVPDVRQDVFLIVHRKLATFEGRSTLRTWMYRICVRTAADYHRRAHRRYERVTTTPPQAPAVETQHEDLTMQRTLVVLRRALEGLSPDKRAVFVLYELQEHSMTEIALIMRCPLQTAFTRLYAARRAINRALSSAGWTAGLLATLTPSRTVKAAAPQLQAALETWHETHSVPWAAGASMFGSVAATSAIATLAACALIGWALPDALATHESEALPASAARQVRPSATRSAAEPAAQHLQRKAVSRTSQPIAETVSPDTRFVGISVMFVDRWEDSDREALTWLKERTDKP